MKTIRNIVLLFALVLAGILGVGLYRQYIAPADAPAEQAATTRSVAEPEAAPADGESASAGGLREASAPTEETPLDDGVEVEVPLEGEAEFFALSVKMIDEGVVEIKSRREEGNDARYFVHLVTCGTLRTGVVAQSDDLAGLAERNETPDMALPAEGSAELMLSQIACASVEN